MDGLSPWVDTSSTEEGKPGAMRSLKISNFADKLVQKRVQEILQSIYEPIFLNSFYGLNTPIISLSIIKKPFGNA